MTFRTWLLSLVVAGSLIPAVSFAQRVVVLELAGDRGQRLRGQIELALEQAGVVEIVSLKAFKWTAGKRRLRGAKAMSPTGVARVSRALRLDAAVDGAVSEIFFVRILDPLGRQLWARDIPLKNGRLTASNARKLAKAIAVAAAQKGQAADGEEEQSDRDGVEEGRPSQRPVADAPVSDATGEGEGASAGAATPPSLPELDLSKPPSEQEQRQVAALVQAQTPVADEDLYREAPDARPKPTGPSIPALRLALGGSFTWRSYCSRPGVTTCKAHDDLAEKPQGDTVDFVPKTPYAGFGLDAELFPFTTSPGLRGLGIVGRYSLAFSLTKVQVASPQGETPEKDVISTDHSYSVMPAYRLLFPFRIAGPPALAHVGVRIGLVGRVFDVDPDAQVPLPGSHRSFPAGAVDVGLPIIGPSAVLHLSAGYYLNPRPGPDEIAGYGNASAEAGGARGSGFRLEASITGDLIGAVGYRVDLLTFESFKDLFYGTGQKWENGGAAEERYVITRVGLTISL